MNLGVPVKKFWKSVCMIRTFPSWPTFQLGALCPWQLVTSYIVTVAPLAVRDRLYLLLANTEHWQKRMGFRQILVGQPPTAIHLLCLVVCILLHNVILSIFVQPSFTSSESVYVWNSWTDSCSCQTGKIFGIDFRALIPGDGYYDSDARVWNLFLVEDSGWYLVGGKAVINWASYSQIDWIQPCWFRDGKFTFSLCPAFVIPTYLPHQIINLEPSIAPGSRISTSNLPLLCSQHFLSHLPNWFDIASLPSDVLISSPKTN